jgi:flagellar biosynthesis protein FliR
MQLDDLLQYVPVFVLALFRIAGLMMYAPLLGSAKIPRRVKALFALILALGMTSGIARPAQLPPTVWGVAIAIGGEMIFGFAMGMVFSFVFIAAQWAGQIIGQQIGFNLSEVFDPQYGGASSVVGDLYYMLTLVVFLFIDGHRQMIRGIRDSFDSLPLLSVGMNASVFDLVLRMLETTTVLAVRLAAPLLVTMLVVDLTLGFLGKTMPQLNIMTAGLSIKSMIGMVVLIVGVLTFSTPRVLESAVNETMQTMQAVLHPAVAAVH